MTKMSHVCQEKRKRQAAARLLSHAQSPIVRSHTVTPCSEVNRLRALYHSSGTTTMKSLLELGGMWHLVKPLTQTALSGAHSQSSPLHSGNGSTATITTTPAAAT